MCKDQQTLPQMESWGSGQLPKIRKSDAYEELREKVKTGTPESAFIKWTLVGNINTTTYISNDDRLCDSFSHLALITYIVFKPYVLGIDAWFQFTD